MRRGLSGALMTMTALTVMGCSVLRGPAARVSTAPESTPWAGDPTSSLSDASSTDPFSQISQESLFAYLEALTAIQPHSGWHSSATEGEVEALDYVAGVLRKLEYLGELGLEMDRQRISPSGKTWRNMLSHENRW